MKTRLFAVAAGLVLTVLSSGAVAQAQERLMVNVPFTFMAGKATLPAGAYTVEPLPNAPVVLLKKIGGPAASSIVLTIPAEPKVGQSKSVLVFDHYGEDYVLSQIWSADDQICRALTLQPSRARERESAKGDASDQVTILAYAAPAK